MFNPPWRIRAYSPVNVRVSGGGAEDGATGDVGLG
jgi:hypothetical protein